MQIDWVISAIDMDVASNRATTAHWRVNGSEGAFSGSSYGAVSIQKYAENTPYEAVNEAMAIAWTKAALGKSEVERIERSVADSIAKAQNPDIQTGTPWGQS